MAVKKTMTDKRLLGTWQSDRARTLKELRYRPGMTVKQRKVLRGIFGHLRVTYGRKYIRGVLEDYKFVGPYEVLASDEDSVAIRVYCKTTENWDIRHIHFHDSEHYWISLGFNREWFKRVKPT